jgi:hypothetical protein
LRFWHGHRRARTFLETAHDAATAVDIERVMLT